MFKKLSVISILTMGFVVFMGSDDVSARTNINENIQKELRVHAVIDHNRNGRPDFSHGNPPETHQAGWNINLYEISNDNWELKDSVVTTGHPYKWSANFLVDSGSYAICGVIKDGYEFSFANTIHGWWDFRDDSNVINQSGVVNETPECIGVTVYEGDLEVRENPTSSFVFGYMPIIEEDEEVTDEEDTEREIRAMTTETDDDVSAVVSDIQELPSTGSKSAVVVAAIMFAAATGLVTLSRFAQSLYQKL